MSSREERVLLVEGKGAGSDSLAFALAKKWTRLDITHTGAEALSVAKTTPPDIIIFDASTMRSNGVRTCRRLRKQAPDTPLIHVRAEGQPECSDANADIFLEKPFTSRKLVNRVHILLPANDSEDQIVRAGHLTLYLGKGSIDVGGKGEQPLTPKLTRLLEEFLRNPDEVLSRRQLMENVWQTSYVGDTRTLDVHIRWAREVIEEEPKNPRLLTTVRGVGYIFRVPDDQDGMPESGA